MKIHSNSSPFASTTFSSCPSNSAHEKRVRFRYFSKFSKMDKNTFFDTPIRTKNRKFNGRRIGDT